MRVVFLTHDFPRWSGDRTGALSILTRALVRRGISVRVVAVSEDKSGTTEIDGVPVHLVRSGAAAKASASRSHTLAGPPSGPPAWSHLARLWRALRPAVRQEIAAGVDVIHAHGWAPAGLATPSVVPVVLTVQSVDASLLRQSRIARALARRLFRRTAVVTTVSREVGTWIESGAGRHIGASHIHPMPIDSRGHPWTRGGGGVVVVSPLEASGRVELAIRTVAVLASCGHDLPLTIIGGGPDRDALEQRAAGLGVSALVRFVGDLGPEEARRYLERADLMLFTAKGDGMALVALEGLISGIPVVACWDSGAAVDVVPESGAGRLTLPVPESLADSILELQADPDRFAMARLVGESWRARLAPDHVAGVCEGWYRDALAT
ncbi:MAG: glycosyltransferase family 4 protein [Gemmatimonadales bacterium]